MKWMMLLVVGMAGVVEGQVPRAEEILRTARMVTTLHHQDLHGHLRKDGRKTPLSLFLRGENIQFRFFDEQSGKWMTFHLRLEDKHFDLFEMRDGKTIPFPPKRIAESIRGTDLSYEDLAMRFLYWPNGRVMGAEKVKRQDCWKVWLQNPEKTGRYAFVYVWVHKKSGALMQVWGYDAKRRPLKRFQVTDVMRVGDAYTIRRMRVDSVDPISNKVVGLTYLEFDRPKAAAKGLR